MMDSINDCAISFCDEATAMTAEEIADKYVHGRHSALTDNDEKREMIADIKHHVKAKIASMMRATPQNQNMNYSDFVGSRVKTGDDILKSLTPEKCDLLHMGMGVAGEAGELLDAIKKHIAYDKPLDTINVIEELGDLEFYMERMRQLIGVTREEVIETNVKKLSVRYAEKYTDQEASDRNDKTLAKIDESDFEPGCTLESQNLTVIYKGTPLSILRDFWREKDTGKEFSTAILDDRNVERIITAYEAKQAC